MPTQIETDHELETEVKNQGVQQVQFQPISGPSAEGYYEARQGDCIDSIAFDHGLFWKTIWKHPQNKSLREARKNPNILYPGDVVYVPGISIKEESCVTEKRHCFVRRGVPAKVSIVLKDSSGNPRPDVPYTIQIDGSTTSGKTDSQGRLTYSIPPDAAKGRLILGEARDEIYALQLGNIDPVESLTGIQQRLINLGFFSGSADGEITPETIQAIKDFQTASGLTASGEVDQATRDRLSSEHGC